jgi:hypothetical protein
MALLVIAGRTQVNSRVLTRAFFSGASRLGLFLFLGGSLWRRAVVLLRDCLGRKTKRKRETREQDKI